MGAVPTDTRTARCGLTRRLRMRARRPIAFTGGSSWPTAVLTEATESFSLRYGIGVSQEAHRRLCEALDLREELQPPREVGDYEGDPLEDPNHPFNGDWKQLADEGNTCRTAFSAAMHYDPKSGPLDKLMQRQAQFSKDSQANGALMRITPLAVWGCRLSDEALAAAAMADAKLSHPHEVTQHANAVYCIAIKHLIARPGDAEGAVEAAHAWAGAHACAEVRDWLKEALGDAQGPAANRMIGFVRYGFFYAFRHLSHRTPYREAIRDTLLLKGDTDTNAAIVGGLVGALHGASGVPAHMAAAVLGRLGQPGTRGPKRPDWLQPGHLPELFAKLYGKATGEEIDTQALPGVAEAARAAAAWKAEEAAKAAQAAKAETA
ncbi:hypothetical protein GPECTOR_2g1111 [Gonium pectorale]|uniref:ADP-ribosylglycohydrolase n=1 Tax=Gonium pectorale TaxID=33097 RepID=A0A150H0Q2_GONPE|nr:hypothetical protein GPECTOR_2g1111 [Gonium pectorale]|eukprot:KXZ55562.1 hypothetical protein GPECTOR_2g1111 [Gonium pectorale]